MFGTCMDAYTPYKYQITNNLFLYVYTIEMLWYNDKL